MTRNCKRLLPWLAFFSLFVASCTATNSANTQARVFVQTLVEKPGDIAVLLKLSNAPNATALQQLTSPLSTRVALRYLQASHQQGKSIRYSTRTMSPRDKTGRRVLVKIRRQRSGKQPPDVLRVYVSMSKIAEGTWRIVGIEVRNPVR